MQYGIYVGHSKESIKEAREAVLKIISASHTDEKTKQMALESLSKILGPIKDVHIENCNLYSDCKKK